MYYYFTTIGHHTLENRGNYSEIEKSGPIIAKHDPESNEYQFLGTGYYFWDDNKKMAHIWGKKRYKGKYYIFSSKIRFNNTKKLLDLVGARKHQKLFLELKKFITDYDPQRASWGIGEIIETLKLLNENNDYKGIFPYIAVRAQDNSTKIIDKLNFVKGKNNYTDLNPRYVICLYEKNDIILQNFKCCVNK